MHSGGSSDDVDNDKRILMGKFYTDQLERLLGKPRGRIDELSQREMNIAKSTQVRFEEAAVHCINKLHKLIPTDQLAMAGGCALNGVANARILRETEFTNPYLQPASSDDGTCLGAAYHVWHKVLGREERFHMKHAFWGPEYSDEQIRKVAEKSSFLVKKCINHAELVEEASLLLSKGLVMGWYQGRSEWGPRALGNRSILADPSVPDMKKIINSKIKRRESFRPFAPSVLKEDVVTYFEQDVSSPFMMHVVKIKPDWQKRLPAITHVDGTGRLQSVDKDSNLLYYNLISKFKSKTGIGMLLNTSFNENEPIVDTPQQAYDCFTRTDMDSLCLGNYILQKK
jgi:carbamoyltransferase